MKRSWQRQPIGTGRPTNGHKRAKTADKDMTIEKAEPYVYNTEPLRFVITHRIGAKVGFFMAKGVENKLK